MRNLRVYPINHAREGYYFPDVLRATNPGDRAFQPETESRVRHAAVTAEVKIPLEGLHG
jgi:hypothetical protein